ncbi:MAG: MMPL family transporter [Proteobacteria bacterium]|nr:MMPL family transporter [Pseudomonadota bacterium]
MPIQVEKIINSTLVHSKKLIVLIIILSVPFSYYFIQQQYVNHVEKYFNTSDEDLKVYKAFQETYGNEHQFLIVFEDADIFTTENITTIKRISDAVKAIHGVLRVFSVTEAETVISEGDSIEFRKLFPEINLASSRPLTPSEILSARKKALSSQGIVNMLISENSRITAIICEIANMHVEAKRDLMVKIIDAAESGMKGRLKLRYSGIVYLETELNYHVQKDNETITPIILIFIIFLTGVLLKNAWLSLITFFNLIIILFWSIGLVVLAGETFDMISSMMAAILLAISVSASIHLLSQYRQETSLGNGSRESIFNAMNHVWIACLFTTLTTCIGFLSFVVSQIRPVRIFGFYTAVGIAISFLITMTFVPAMLVLFKKKIKVHHPAAGGNNKKDLFSDFLKGTSRFTTSHYLLICFAAVGVFIITGIGISRIKIETNQVRYFPESNQMKRDMDYIDRHMVGSLPINLLVKATGEAFDFTHPESLRFIDEIKTRIAKAYDNISVSYAISDYFKEVNKAFNTGNPDDFRIPETQAEIIDYYELADSDLTSRMVSSDFMEARVSFQSSMISNEQAYALFEKIEQYLDPELKGRFTYQITGLTKLYLKMDKNLMSTFLKSFSIAFFLIFLMMLLVCRRLYLTLICMIPNMFPIAVTMGIMGWFNIPLDVATILIASVVLGIAVDDTIHFTVRLKRNAILEPDLKKAIRQTYSDVGKQIVITSVVLFVGFGLLVFGSVIPVRTFGLLTGFSMLFALLGDMIILPAMIMVFRPELQTKTIH